MLQLPCPHAQRAATPHQPLPSLMVARVVLRMCGALRCVYRSACGITSLSSISTLVPRRAARTRNTTLSTMGGRGRHRTGCQARY